jgi:hypothetical protein
MADVREQAVTQAFSPLGVLDLATTLHIGIDRLGRYPSRPLSSRYAVRR